MSLLSKFVESLHLSFERAHFREITKPVSFDGNAYRKNVILMLNRGHLNIGNDQQVIPETSFCFFSSHSAISVRHGLGEHTPLDEEEFMGEKQKPGYFRKVSALENMTAFPELCTFVTFDLLLYDTIPFFEMLGIPQISLPPDEEFGYLVKHIAIEDELNKLGRDKIIRNYMEEIIIHMCRYMDSQSRFQPFMEKLEFLNDRRLVDIVKYIQDNLEKDLSNKIIATIAYVSEDYVGQFFKTMTGKNLQDYIENKRLERAMFLLRTQPDNIQEIAHRVGFKDPAYFSRRFKMKFGSNANAMRFQKAQPS